jgi:chaperonin GroEL
MSKSTTKKVVFQPDVHQAVLRGIDQITNVVRCTLGPLGSQVAFDRTSENHKPPEVLDNGGAIARRIIQLADRDEDMGAMLARAMIYRQDEQYGDGTATAAVLFQTIVREALRYVAAGGNAMLLRRHLQEGLLIACQELDRMRFEAEGKERLVQVAESICHDPEMAELLGEIFETIGEYGQLEVRKGYERGLKREYVAGMYWQKGLFSRQMIADTSQMRTNLENASVFISDIELKYAQELVPVLETALRAGIKSLVIVARSLSEQVIAFLLANSAPARLQVIAVKTPGDNADDRAAALEDLAILTGGTPFLKVIGQAPTEVKAQDFGRARRFWATHQNFGLEGGKGDPRALNRHIRDLQARCARIRDTSAREKLQQRIGKLLGGAATLWVGGVTDSDIAVRKALAERAARVMREAIRGGVLSGAGMALFNCRGALEQAALCSTGPDGRAAYRILSKAVEAPARAIIANAGFDPSQIMARLVLDGESNGFDALAGRTVNLVESGLLDVASVQKGALNNAVTTAALTLTIDVLVHRSKPDIATEPDSREGIQLP